MKSFAFGSLNFDRQSVPEELRDMAVWPSVDEIALGETDRDVYRRKELAIKQSTVNAADVLKTAY